MKLSKWQKNIYPTVVLLSLSLAMLAYLILTRHTGGKFYPISLLLVFAFSGYIIYLVREKQKLRQASRDRKER